MQQDAHRSSRTWLVAGGIFAVVATALLVLSDDARWLRLGIVAALWAALLGGFLATHYRRQADRAVESMEDAQAMYELELEREVAARREYELEIEAEAKQAAEESSRMELDALRAEVTTLRETLQRLFGGEVLYERVALTAQSTRMRSLHDRPQRKTITAEPHNPHNPHHGDVLGEVANPAVRSFELADQRTELIARVLDAEPTRSDLDAAGASSAASPLAPPPPRPAQPPSQPRRAPARRAPEPPRGRPEGARAPSGPADAARRPGPPEERAEPEPRLPDRGRAVGFQPPGRRPERPSGDGLAAQGRPESPRGPGEDPGQGGPRLDRPWSGEGPEHDPQAGEVRAAGPVRRRRPEEFGPEESRPVRGRADRGGAPNTRQGPRRGGPMTGEALFSAGEVAEPGAKAAQVDDSSSPLMNPTLPAAVRRHARPGGRRRKADPEPTEMFEQAVPRLRGDEEEPSWTDGESDQPSEGPGGRRALDSESGSHSTGRSVAELLAAYGSDVPRRRRRQD